MEAETGNDAPVFRRGFLVVVSGPSAAGKNTLLNAVMPSFPDALYSVSATTRPPRPGEVDGRDYFFLTEEEFQEKVDRGEFLEWATFVGYRYGTPRKFVEDNLAAGKTVLMDIDIQGAAQVKARMPQAVFVFILPPSMKVLAQRLKARGKDPEEAMVRRLGEVSQELARLPQYDYIVFNENLDDAANALRSIIAAERCRVNRYDTDQIVRRFFANEGGVGVESTVPGTHTAQGG